MWAAALRVISDLFLTVRMCVSGLLQYRGPHRMLAIAGGGAEEESDHEDDEESENRDDREAQDHSSIEEHIFEHLPPRVHQGTDREQDYGN